MDSLLLNNGKTEITIRKSYRENGDISLTTKGGEVWMMKEISNTNGKYWSLVMVRPINDYVPINQQNNNRNYYNVGYNNSNPNYNNTLFNNNTDFNNSNPNYNSTINATESVNQKIGHDNAKNSNNKTGFYNPYYCNNTEFNNAGFNNPNVYIKKEPICEMNEKFNSNITETSNNFNKNNNIDEAANEINNRRKLTEQQIEKIDYEIAESNKRKNINQRLSINLDLIEQINAKNNRDNNFNQLKDKSTNDSSKKQKTDDKTNNTITISKEEYEKFFANISKDNEHSKKS